jgi:hypothetical protein
MHGSVESRNNRRRSTFGRHNLYGCPSSREGALDVTDYPFNDEFLFTETDRANAQELYGKIYPALDHPELRAVFAPIDEEANAAKRRSRISGFAAVVLVAGAFLGVTAGEAFLHDRNWLLLVSGVSAAFSVAGVLLGTFGVLFAKSKHNWLVNRFLTERLRQFHFQTLIQLAPDIVKAAGSGQWDAFLRERAIRLAAFKEDVIKRPLPLINALLEDAEQDAWLFPYSEPTLVEDENTALLFQAYRRLRIRRQIAFADYKLQTTRRVLSPFPLDQAGRLAGIAMACVFGLFLLHLLTPINLTYSKVPSEVLSFAAVATAILALAVRTLEEGLRPGREVERYRAYQSALRAIEHRFCENDAPASKLKAMAALETLSFTEMINFLKSNYEARFVM